MVGKGICFLVLAGACIYLLVVRIETVGGFGLQPEVGDMLRSNEWLPPEQFIDNDGDQVSPTP